MWVLTRDSCRVCERGLCQDLVYLLCQTVCSVVSLHCECEICKYKYLNSEFYLVAGILLFFSLTDFYILVYLCVIVLQYISYRRIAVLLYCPYHDVYCVLYRCTLFCFISYRIVTYPFVSHHCVVNKAPKSPS